MNSITQQLTPGTTVLTANQRQAAQLRAAHDRHQRDGGDVWEALDILPWDAWLQRLWGELTLLDDAAPLLLTPLQERLLWEQVITESPVGETLLQPAPAARRAQEAWQLLHAWRQPLSVLDDGTVSEEARAFAGWGKRFAELCDRNGWLDRSRLAHAIVQRIVDVPLPQAILLSGFDELTPIQRRLLDALRERGCPVTEAEPAAATTPAQRVACRDTADELRHAARWARTILIREPQARIAIVVPDLTALRAPVARALEDVLMPAAVIEGDGGTPLFNLSLGRRLCDYAVIEEALTLLELGALREGLDTERIGTLLRSPYLAGAAAESGARARLDARLRELGEPRYRVGTLLFQARDERHPCPQLVERWEAWWNHCRELPSRQGAAAWSHVCAELLRLAGWPQGRPLNSTEYQAVEAWRGVLGQLATLDELGAPLTLRQAVARLRQIAAETLFQPRTPEVPIQVLGLLEAAGLDFDHLWIVGLHDEVWPSSPRPNPFLPIALQRRCAMPHSSAERELEFARRITRRLLGAAPAVVASWPQQEADRQLRPSPLIADLPVTDAVRLGLMVDPDYTDLIRQSAQRESLDDAWAPALAEGSTVRGGAALFKEQAACPFRAFARFRLGAEPLGAPHPGLDALTRGSLLHNALELLWMQLGDSRTLAGLDDAARRAAVETAVAEAVARDARLRPSTFTERFTRLEQGRLSDLLETWLALEAQRAPFAVIAPEEQRRIALGGLELSARIDRIDRLDDGRHVIIDYKSGTTAVSKWFGERPDEPQLPLYAVSEAVAPAALAFAEVRTGQVRFNGLAREGDLVPQLRTRAPDHPAEWSWETLLAEWRATLTALAEAFRSGDARVDPKRGAQTCRYCELPALCRIVTGVEAPVPEEEDGGE